MPEKGERNKPLTSAEERRRTYGAERDAETERQQEQAAEKTDTREDLYGGQDDDRDKDANPKSPLEEAAEAEREELKDRRPE